MLTPHTTYRNKFVRLFVLFLLIGLNGLGQQCADAVLKVKFTPSFTEVCTADSTIPQPLTFVQQSTGTSSNAATYTWYLQPLPAPIGTTIGLGSVPAVFNIAGTGAGTYVVIGKDPVSGCYDTAKIAMNISVSPVPAFTIDKNNQCAGSVVSFVNATTPDIYPTATYLWEFGDGNTSTLKNPTHSYVVANSYNVKLTVYNNSICSAFITKPVTVIAAPKPNFTFTNNNKCTGTTLVFTNTSTDTIAGNVTYDWDFGDGSAHATTLDATHQYATANTYTVTLTVSNGGNCKITKTGVVTVSASPVAAFTVAGGTCIGNLLSFTNTSTGTTGLSSYQWSFGDPGGVSNSQNPTHAYTSVGPYNVTLTVSNGVGCSSTSPVTQVIIKNTPVATFSYTNPSCVDKSVIFKNTSTTNAGVTGTYLWDFGDATSSTTENPTHLYSGNGTYDVTLTITDPLTSCSTKSAITKIEVGNLAPAVSFTATPVKACGAALVTFNNTTVGEDPVNNFIWDLGDGVPIAGVKNPAPKMYYQGTHSIRLIAVNACGRDTLDQTITIDTVPTVKLKTNTTRDCLPINFIATNNSTGGHLAYEWYVNGILTDISQTLPPQVFTTASNIVKLKVTNTCGTKDTTVTITASPAVKAVISPLNITVCSDKEFELSYSQTVKGDSLKFLWTFENGVTSTDSIPPKQTFLNPGVYNNILIVKGKCGSDTSTAILKVNPGPLAPTVADTAICKGTAVNLIATAPGEKYEWFDVPNGILLKIGASYTTPVLNVGKTYYVQSTQFGCTSPLKKVTVNVKPVPLAPTVNSPTICAGDSALLTATGAVGVGFEWFNLPTGGIKLDSVAAHQTSPLIVTTNFYVQTSLNGCASARVKSIVKVNPIPASPTAASVDICSGSTATLKATAPGGTYTWYDQPTGGVLLYTGVSYTTSPLNQDTAFYVQSQISNCAGPRTRVTISVHPVPVVAIAASDSSICIGTEIDFTNKSTTGGIYNWYFAGGVPATSSQYAPMPIKFTVAGKKLVYLSVNMAGCIVNDSLYIDVDAFPKTAYTLTPMEGCSPLIVAIKNTSTTVPSVTYAWDFGNGTTSSLQNPPAQTFTSSGVDSSFSIKLLMSSPLGCKDSLAKTVSVFANPKAAFRANVPPACVFQAIGFTSETLTATSWTWYFGDGTSSTDKLPKHIYTLPGTYTVKLVVTGSHGCSDSVSHDVIVNPAPTASFTAEAVCNSFPTEFIDKSTADATGWEWNFGDGTPFDKTFNPTHVYANAGKYDVILSVKNVFGCSDTALQKVLVVEKPKTNFSADKVCAKQLIKLNDSTIGTNLIDWKWTFGDGSANSSIQSPTHIYSKAGLYPVKLVVKNSVGCSDSIVRTIRISTIPTPLFTANLVCEGKGTSFKDLSTDSVAIVKWFYDFNDGNNSISKNPSYVYGKAGTYNVSLTVTNIDGCDSTFTMPISVDITPVPKFTADTICMSDSTTFTDVSTGTPIKWAWDFGDGKKDTIGPVTKHLYATAGTFIVSLKVETLGGCKAEKIDRVVVRNDVKASFIVKDTACVNELLLMTDNTATAGTIASSSWDFGDGSPKVLSLDAKHTYIQPGMYGVTHIVIGNGGCKSTVTDSILVNSGPKADFSSAGTCIGQASTFKDESTPSPTSWKWDFKDGTTSPLQNPKHTFDKGGTYSIFLSVTSGLGCSDTVSKKITVYSSPKASFQNNTSCWADTTNFINTSNPMDGTITSVFWDFDDGTTDSILSPNHVFNTKNDSFAVMMVIVTNHGCRDTVTKTVNTYPIPKFKFGASETSGCNKFTTSFHDSSTVSGGTITNWLWNFGDKSLTYKNDVSHTYISEGKFYVSLTLTTSYGCRMVDTLKYPVFVYPKPIAGFTATPSHVSMYEPIIKFTDQSEKATVWDWDLGDGASTTDQYFSHTYTDTGTFIVTQIAINPYGCMDTIQHHIRIDGEPTMFIPNTFTPDENGVNDVFLPKMYGVREFKMDIYDRWGSLIFSSTDSKIGWNGKVKGTGETVKDDTYVYVIYVRDLMNSPHKYRGHITVVKMGDGG